jgi:transposase
MKSYCLDDYDFVALAKATADKRLYQRLIMLAHLKAGMPKSRISRLLFVSTDQVYYWLERFDREGIEGLQDKARSGRPRVLDSSHHEELKKRIEESQTALLGGRLRGEDISQLIKDEWDVEYSLSGIYALMKVIGMSWVSTRSRHPKQNEEAQQTFKKTS